MVRYPCVLSVAKGEAKVHCCQPSNKAKHTSHVNQKAVVVKPRHGSIFYFIYASCVLSWGIECVTKALHEMVPSAVCFHVFCLSIARNEYKGVIWQMVEHPDAEKQILEDCGEERYYNAFNQRHCFTANTTQTFNALNFNYLTTLQFYCCRNSLQCLERFYFLYFSR